MDQKIIFLDIDGTLTESGSNEVPESAAWAAEQARKQGHYVFLCTGRNYDMLLPLLKYEFDGIVGSSGGCQILISAYRKETKAASSTEIVNKALDKGKAVERVCSYLQIPLSNSIAFGDSMNDLEMMQTAGLSICMSNGSEKLKK